MKHSPKPPPKWAAKLLHWLHPSETIEEVEGDLAELYAYWHEQKGKKQADVRYVLAVLSVLPPFVKRRSQKYSYSQPSFLHSPMLYNYLTIGLRNLLRYKVFSFINIIGLAIGLACSTVIVFFVNRELSFDRFHHQPEQVYRVVADFINDDGTLIPGATTPPALAPVLDKDLPEVAYATRLYPEPGNMILVEYGNKRFYEADVMRVDSSFFNVFNFPFQQGNAASALSEPNAVVLTQTIAKKYFGDLDPIGKILKMGVVDGEKTFTVTGVLKDVPENSHFTFNFLIPLKFEPGFVRDDLSTIWFWYNYYTYLRLKPGTDAAAITAKLQPLVNKYVPKHNKNQFYIQSLTDIHLHSALKSELSANGDATYVGVLIMIGLLVIVLAGINYINLITAQAAKRAKEIGIRKVAGAVRSSLTLQFLMESLLTALLAFAVAILAVIALLPVIRELVGSRLLLFSAQSIPVWLLLMGIVLVIGLLAGLYPAFYLSSLQPAGVLKGKFATSGKGILLRKGLVVFQFVISICLLAGAFIISRQLTYMQHKKLGFDQENILVIPNAAGLKNHQALVNAWKQKPEVINIGKATGMFGGDNWTLVVRPKNQKDGLFLNFLVVDYNFLPVMNVSFKEGRNFSRAFGTDNKAIVLNQAAVRQLGLKEPVLGQQIEWNVGGDKDNFYHIIGVVEDFHFTNFREAIKPYGFVANIENPGTLFVKFRSKDLTHTLAELQEIWERFVPERPFVYSFQDEQMAGLHQEEARFGLLISTLTAMAIVIACLGLLGLAIFTVEQRSKEIAVRKILGAHTVSIVALLSRDFVVPIAVAFVMATPVAWYAMDKWLQNFAYRIDIAWWMFLLAGLLAAGIALLTVSFQAIKAAMVNPVKSLRNE
jgi:putative ABC transport system permease protein